MAIPAQFMWIIDFIMEIFGTGFGRTEFLFNYGLDVFLGSLNIHIILIPTALYLVYKRGFHPKCYWYVQLVSIILLGGAFLFSPPVENVNCVFYDCDASFDVFYGKEVYLEYGKGQLQRTNKDYPGI